MADTPRAWTCEQVREVTAQIHLGELAQDWRIAVRDYLARTGERRVSIAIQHYRRDVVTGRPGWGEGGEYLLPELVTEQQIVFKCFAAYDHYRHHETRETFEYEEVRIMGPHPNLHMLMRVQTGEFG